MKKVRIACRVKTISGGQIYKCYEKDGTYLGYAGDARTAMETYGATTVESLVADFSKRAYAFEKQMANAPVIYQKVSREQACLNAIRSIMD